jgi:hypothetical protein
LHDCNLFSKSFLSHKGLNYDLCYVIHCRTFYSLNVIVVVLMAEFVSLCYKIKIIFHAPHYSLLQWWMKEVIKQVFWFLLLILLSLASQKFAEVPPDTVICSFKYIRHWDDFQWHRYVQSSRSLPVDWMTNTVTAGMTCQETSLRMDTLVDTDLHQNSN